jgi:hypothetical protein
MSIRIGTQNGYNVTERERVYVQSSTYSNLILMYTSPQTEANIEFDENLTFGRQREYFAFQKNGVPMAHFSNTRFHFFTPATFQHDVRVVGSTLTGSLTATQSVNANTFQGNRLELVGTGQTPYIFTSTPTGMELIKAFTDGMVVLPGGGRLGIGTVSVPAQRSLHVEGDAYISARMTASTATARRVELIDDLVTPQFISLSNFNGKRNVWVGGNTIIAGDFDVLGQFTIQQSAVESLVARSNLIGTAGSFSNHFLQQHTCTLFQNSARTLSNLLQTDIIHPQRFAGRIHPLIIHPEGRVGVGTLTPTSMFQISFDERMQASNLLQAEGTSSDAIVSISKDGFVGIGTSEPFYPLHLEQPITIFPSAEASNAFISLYNLPMDESLHRPLLQASQGDQQVVYMSPAGRVTLGNIPHDEEWTLDVACNVRAPFLQSSYIAAMPGTCNLDFQNSTFCNVQDVFGKNLHIEQLTSMSNLVTNFFYASNFSIEGMDGFSSKGFFRVYLPSFLFEGSNMVLSSRESDRNVDPIDFGKLRIYADNARTPDGLSVGLNVLGATNTSMDVTSASRPSIRLLRVNNQNQVQRAASLQLNPNTFSIVLDPADQFTNREPFVIGTYGVRLNTNVLVDMEGRMGINLGGTLFNPTLPTSRFHMKGNANFDSDTFGSLLFVNELTGNVGIGNTTNPSFKLHVVGNAYVSSNLTVQQDIIVQRNISVPVGNIGIGTTPNDFRLNVGGNLNFDGDLYQRGALYISSQWTTTNDRTRIFILNSNVGIHTNNPRTPLHVEGVAYTTRLGVGTTDPAQRAHVYGGNMCVTSGNLGLGTTTPQHPLHVQGLSFFSSNVAIGTTPSHFRLHVNGDMNFDGDLFQRSSRYVSSQWLSGFNPSFGSNIYYTSNVGIGTTNPTSGLHVFTSCTFNGGIVNFQSNVNVFGTLATRGSVTSISDQALKINLEPIGYPLDRIDQITGYTYDRIDTQQRECGLIAQEVQHVLPEVVHPSMGDPTLSIAYGNMAGLFVEAIKALHQKVQTLEDRIRHLEAGG